MLTTDRGGCRWRIGRRRLLWWPRRPWLLRRSAEFVRMPDDGISLLIVLVAIVIFVPMCLYWLLSWTATLLIAPGYGLGQLAGWWPRQVQARRLDNPAADDEDGIPFEVHRYPVPDAAAVDRLTEDLNARLYDGRPLPAASAVAAEYTGR